MALDLGDTLRLLDSNFRVVGIYETGVAFEEIGVVIGLREAQSLTGKPHQAQIYAIDLRDSEQTKALQTELKAAYPGIDLALAAELAETMSSFRLRSRCSIKSRSLPSSLARWGC